MDAPRVLAQFGVAHLVKIEGKEDNEKSENKGNHLAYHINIRCRTGDVGDAKANLVSRTVLCFIFRLLFAFTCPLVHLRLMLVLAVIAIITS